jgi:ankyrin repeat protein
MLTIKLILLQECNTALHIFAKSNNLPIVELLLRAGADVTLMNNSKEKAVQLATERKVVKLLEGKLLYLLFLILW